MRRTQMVDRVIRLRFAEMLRQLCSGAMTLDAFDDLAAELHLRISADDGIRAIISWAESFYELPTERNRFRGKARLSDEDRKRFSTAVLFMYSDLPYEWPEVSGFTDFFLLWVCGILASGSLFGFVLAESSCFFLLLGALLASSAIRIFFFARRKQVQLFEEWKELQRTLGREFDVWPFAKTEDFDEQRIRPRLLSGGS